MEFHLLQTLSQSVGRIYSRDQLMDRIYADRRIVSERTIDSHIKKLLLVMVAIPFGAVGALLGHLLIGFSLSVVSLMGIIALSGLVVNDSLVLIDYANRQRREGLGALDVIIAAGTQRFRPVLLTTLTTFGGLAPMIFETSVQAKIMIPMAISLGYGILFAAVISLLLVPSLYLILDDFAAPWRAPALPQSEPRPATSTATAMGKPQQP